MIFFTVTNFFLFEIQYSRVLHPKRRIEKKENLIYDHQNL